MFIAKSFIIAKTCKQSVHQLMNEQTKGGTSIQNSAIKRNEVLAHATT